MMRFRPSRSLILALALPLSACSAPDQRAPHTLDCGLDDGYDLKFVPEFEGAGTNNFFPAADKTFGAVASATPTALPAEENCQDPASTGAGTALVVRFSGNHDWGGLVGTYALTDGAQGVAVDANGPFEGLSFWAKNIGDRGFVLVLTDRNTDGTSNPDPGCTEVIRVGEGGYPLPEDCGNFFQALVMPTPWWSFYTIPFAAFTQDPLPNRVEGGIDPNQILRIIIRASKDTNVELWLDGFAWYRKKPSSN